MKRKIKRKTKNVIRKTRVSRPRRKAKKLVLKIRRRVGKKQPKKEKNLIKKLERAAKKQGVSLFTYVRKASFKKSKK
ncbi:MAG: hypothetical protein WCI04_02855 [archaeon]